MEKTLKFKTNIKCMGCVAQVTPALDDTAGAGNWDVDLQSPDRPLTVKGGKTDAAGVTAALAKAGFKASEL
ncbi:MAG: heavy metal transport/detoxification protein [Lewinellaceae bacterium]|nr:heavy metal transport/detoxification protein [Lewinellaceae bacterium]